MKIRVGFKKINTLDKLKKKKGKKDSVTKIRSNVH